MNGRYPASNLNPTMPRRLAVEMFGRVTANAVTPRCCVGESMLDAEFPTNQSCLCFFSGPAALTRVRSRVRGRPDVASLIITLSHLSSIYMEMGRETKSPYLDHKRFREADKERNDAIGSGKRRHSELILS